jgi:hypothetical protein
MQEQKVLTELPALTTLRVISNGALRGEKLPERIKIFNWGENPSIKGTFHAGEHTLAVLEANQRALGYERVAIDYNHCTVPGAPDHQAGKPPAVFGYGRPRVVKDDGIYLEDVTWTPLGLEHARNYEDLSPAVAPGASGEIELIHSVALTTNGALQDVTFFSATKPKDEIENEKTMSTTTSPGAGVLTLALLASSLGLAASATEAEVTGKIQRLSGLEGQLTTLSSRLEALEQRLQQTHQAAETRERGEIIALMAQEGRAPKNAEGQAYSAEDLAKLEVATLKILRANTPATVVLTAKAGKPAEGGQANGLKGLARTAAAFQAQIAQAQAD